MGHVKFLGLVCLYLTRCRSLLPFRATDSAYCQFLPSIFRLPLGLAYDFGSNFTRLSQNVSCSAVRAQALYCRDVDAVLSLLHCTVDNWLESPDNALSSANLCLATLSQSSNRQSKFRAITTSVRPPNFYIHYNPNHKFQPGLFKRKRFGSKGIHSCLGLILHNITFNINQSNLSHKNLS